MKIAVCHNQPSGGARRALHGFCRELARRHRVDVFTLSTADREMLRDEDVAATVTRLPYAPRPPIRGGLYLNDVRRRQSFADLDRVNAELARLIDGSGYDVALVDACRFTGAPYVLKYLRTPSAYYCHHRPRRLDEYPASPTSLYERARDLWHLPFERHLQRLLWKDDAALMHHASRVLVNSDYTRRQLAEIHGLQAAVCPPGVELPLAGRGTKQDYILSVGALEPRKGFILVIDALTRVPAPRPSLHIVANDGNPRVRSQIAERAAQLGIQTTIRILPPQTELAREYRQALLFAYGARDEPLGLAPLEAMSYGLSVVAVGEAGVRETIDHGRTGYLVNRDPVDFGARLTELLSSALLRAKMGEAGRAAVREHWSWPQRAAALATELETLASRQRVNPG